MLKNKLTHVLLSMLIAVIPLTLLFPTCASAESAGTVTVYNKDGTVKQETGFDSCDSAWDAAVASAGSGYDTVMTLGCDWTHDRGLELPSNKKLTVDLNGFTILRDRGGKQISNGYVFRVANGAELTIRDSNPESAGYNGIRGGVITGGANTNGAGAIHIDAGGYCLMRSGTIYRCTSSEHGGAVMLDGRDGKYARFVTSGGRIYFCQTVDATANCHGGGIYSNYGGVYLSNFSVDACYSEDNGGGVYLNEGNLTIENSLFIGNHCKDYGGGVYINSGRLLITGSRFSTNEASDDGGAVYIDTGDRSEIKNSIFYKNKSYGEGGALYVNDDRSYVLDCDFSANSAAGYGGAIYVDSRYDISLKGLMRIVNNSGRDGRNNLTLQNGLASRAYLYNGGLTEGSSVGLSSTGRNQLYCKEMTAYQAEHYYFSDLGELELTDTFERDASLLASLFIDSEYAVWLIGAVCAAGCAAIVYLLLRKNAKRKGAAVG